MIQQTSGLQNFSAEAKYIGFSQIMLFILCSLSLIGFVGTLVVAFCFFADTRPQAVAQASRVYFEKPQLDYSEYKNKRLADFKNKKAAEEKSGEEWSGTSRSKEMIAAQKRKVDQKKQEVSLEEKRLANMNRENRFLKEILVNLERFADAVNKVERTQPAVDPGRIEGPIRQVVEDLRRLVDEEAPWIFLESLVDVTNDLATDASNILELYRNDGFIFRWNEFLLWYIEEYRAAIEDELNRLADIKLEERRLIEAEAVRVALAESEAYRMAAVAAGLLGMFILLTIMLAVLRIDMHARRIAAFLATGQAES